MCSSDALVFKVLSWEQIQAIDLKWLLDPRFVDSYSNKTYLVKEAENRSETAYDSKYTMVILITSYATLMFTRP